MNKITCNICSKNITLINFDCKCNGKFCINHRFRETHKCEYSFIKEEQEKIFKENPKIVINKINII